VESDRAFYGTPEVIDFLNVLRVLQNPADTVSLVGLLRSPLVLLEDREILALAEARRLDDRRAVPPGLPEETANRLAQFYGDLGRWREWARQESLGELVARLLRETKLLATAATAYHGEQSVSNVLKLARLAADANSARGETLAAFTRQLTNAVGDGVEEGESPLGEERADAVRLVDGP
jgi:ATP-dependent helicase/nuclease subunit A